MKNFTVQLLLCLVLLMGMTSCEKFLEIAPEGEIPTEDALKTPRDVQLLLNSCYDVLRSGKFMGGKMRNLSDLMADDRDGRALSGNWLSYYAHNTSIFNQDTRELWSEPYIMIYRCNVLLENMDLVPDLSDDQKARTTAEAKFLRAVGHFELVRMFANPYGFTSDNSHDGIPLRIQASQEAIPRAAVGEIYAQVLSDLEDAKDVLPGTNGGYATSWAVKAYLARVHFQMNDFQNAFNYADEVINGGGFVLDSNVMARFSTAANNENIFNLISTGSLNNSGAELGNIYRSTNLSNPPGGRMSQELYLTATADSNDLRGRNFYVLANPGQSNELVLLTRFNEPWFNVPLLHLAEMLLIRAESAAELGNLAQAEADINAIRNRAGLADVTPGLDAASLKLLIRTERRLEMPGEGYRFHDLRRQGVHDSPNLLINGSPWNCNGMMVQLPDEERSGNPTIVLNPEGGC
jgi:starch-binding outer membrane protein, SusD/RagB family